VDLDDVVIGARGRYVGVRYWFSKKNCFKCYFGISTSFA